MAGTTTGRATHLRSLAFPALVFVGWRLFQLALSLAFGANAVDSAFSYDGQAAGLGAVMLQQGLEMGEPLALVSAQKYWQPRLDFPWSSLRKESAR